ncbi:MULTISPECIES: hypothetical protein [unclassified Mesorhizobium]|uniref:hypothetical protein n=1 Tax=unclassified Mesorhizobium TaxID=325217 RepID=UPI0011293EC3|nr:MULTISPECIES: hypothetical protein [unclassified Mesorhizobium]MBZ9982465.1 hypothetical protein [Mesorhizobium sp. BR-1-1-8]TPL32278.1 hypothetical protein FJ947_22685 [Mesorhizobium sp. B2-4-8]TPL61142.1 hypothetical protein FJ949_23675 [Mesorhizobium sp. B2-4-1]
MTMLFEPLNSDGHKRSVLYHAARSSMLHDRLVNHMGRVDRLADEVERAAAVLIDVTHGSAVVAFQDAVFRNSSAAFLHLEAGQTLGL